MNSSGLPVATADEAPSGGRRARSRWLGPLALGVVGALIGVVAFVVVADPSDSKDVARPTPPAASPSTTLGPARSTEVYRTIQPSLVYIRTQASADRGGIGSGVIVNTKGQILTAYHVVRDASSIAVTFADGTEARARVVDAEPAHDIAVLESDGRPQVIVPAVLGSSAGLRVGDEAYPAGNPLGYANSLTAGVISGLDRSVEREDGSGVFDGLIQFDAAVNPGSSGGPLLNRDGQVIGIVTALANPSQRGFFIGIGFAVPIATATGGSGGPLR